MKKVEEGNVEERDVKRGRIHCCCGRKLADLGILAFFPFYLNRQNGPISLVKKH